MNKNRFGSMEMEIQQVQLLDDAGETVDHLDSGDPLVIEMKYLAPQALTSPIFGVTLTREDGTVCIDTSQSTSDEGSRELRGAGVVRTRFSRLDLAPGMYYVNVGVYQEDWQYAFDYHWQVYPLKIGQGSSGKSFLQPPQQWEIEPEID